ncbi:MAG: hypothetical protein GX575_14840 [Candidatus Anammoximicrobium sp.]|nr:hypothetical protein [Candidatus Anammoximicrobium sp.]
MPGFYDIANLLPDGRRAGDFAIRFGARDPLSGRGLGVHGVVGTTLIDCYAEGLDRATRTLRAAGWEAPDEPIEVLVCEPSEVVPWYKTPITLLDKDRRHPFVVLLSQPNEPTWDAALNRATVEAVHEATHAFNFRCYSWLLEKSWTWLDEATAMFLEQFTFPEIGDRLRYARWWAARPERPLDADDGRYEAGFFMQYLVQRYGVEFLSRLWTQRKKDSREDPFAGIQRALGSPPFSSVDPHVDDVFGAGYCVDAYFTKTILPEVAVRYGGRAVSWSFELKSPTTAVLPGGDGLDHLACKYYRIFVTRPVSGLRVTVTEELASGSNDGTGALKAFLLQVGPFGQQIGAKLPLEETASPEPEKFRPLTAQWPTPIADRAEFVLVVANCELDKNANGRSFQIEIQTHS